ncbi:hypothetical protein QQP08_015666 [Theobroma cacao]|nr:hypothetical protein QQP08_015666 [Theobroma cacao]
MHNPNIHLVWCQIWQGMDRLHEPKSTQRSSKTEMKAVLMDDDAVNPGLSMALHMRKFRSFISVKCLSLFLALEKDM